MKFTQPQVLTTDKNKQNLAKLNEMMDDARVKQYLLDNPKFLVNNPELLSHIELDHAQENTFSLVERQVKALRDKNSHLQGQQIEMLQMAFANEELLKLCNQFMLELVDCQDLAALTSRIVNRIKNLFGLDGVAVVLVGQYKNASPAQVFSNPDQLKTLLNCQFPDNQPLCGRLNQGSKVALFGELSQDFQSCALVPLGEGCEKGLLALASKDVARFSPEMGTLFVELIAKYIQVLVARFEQ